MPRGGRRPGAGAPKGNFNAVRSGNRSRRMLMVYLALINHPDKRAIARELAEHGLIHPPRGPRREVFSGDVRPIVAYLYRRWFDNPESGQSPSIDSGQLRTSVGPSAESETALALLRIALDEKDALGQLTIKTRHVAGLPALPPEDESP